MMIFCVYRTYYANNVYGKGKHVAEALRTSLKKAPKRLRRVSDNVLVKAPRKPRRKALKKPGEGSEKALTRPRGSPDEAPKCPEGQSGHGDGFETRPP